MKKNKVQMDDKLNKVIIVVIYGNQKYDVADKADDNIHFEVNAARSTNVVRQVMLENTQMSKKQKNLQLKRSYL